MTRKKVLVMLGAVVLAVGIALAGIWYNAQLPPLAYPGAPAQDAEILFTTWADRYPAEGQTALTLRTTLQWLAVTVFCTLAAVVLALYYYKHQRELGYFLLYLAVLIAWGAAIILSPISLDPVTAALKRCFFPLTVLAPILLSSALTGVAPVSRTQKLLVLVLTMGYFPIALHSDARVRAVALFGGMIYCMGLLLLAYDKGSASDLLLLFPYAVTAGLRTWVILPGLDLPFFSESIQFYLVRCARIYDIPFTLGCMTFVCRRFALQFDRTELLARELDERVVQRTRALTEESEARKSMMLNIFHDLRSPLFAVSSGLDTLEAAPDALPALLPAMQQRMTFLRRLTEDLFLAAKLEQKQVMLNEDRVSLSEAAAAVCESCQNEAAKKGVIVALRLWNDGGADARNGEILDFLRSHTGDNWPEMRNGSFLLRDHLYLERAGKFDWPDLSANESGAQFCYGLRDQLGVLVDGTVVPCCLDHEGDVALGNLFTQPLTEILTSPRACALREGFSRRKPAEELCRRCGFAARFNK